MVKLRRDTLLNKAKDQFEFFHRREMERLRSEGRHLRQCLRAWGGDPESVLVLHGKEKLGKNILTRSQLPGR